MAIIARMGKEVRLQGKARGGWLRLWVLILGIVLPQIWMFGGALAGRTVLLPLDSFVSYNPGFYPESTAEGRESVLPPRWPNLVDNILQYEPFRRFAVEEIHAGRVPAWNPHSYAGTPFIGGGQSAVFSPYRLIDYLSMDPVVLAWSQLAKALIAGLGMYCFLRWGLRLTWGAAAAGAWLYPWTGYMTVWFGMTLAAGATWMGWVLLATEYTARGGGRRWAALLGVFICFTIFAGHPQIAGHTLALSGVYALWRVGKDYWKRRSAGEAIQRFAACVAGWVLGVGLAAVQLWPLLEYTFHSQRWAMRASGVQERPAQGAWALMQMVQPWIAGEISPSSVYLLEGNRQESGAAGYAGLLVFFVLVPLAWRLRRWRGEGWFWACIAVLGMSAVAGIPLLDPLTRMWPLGILSSNRLACLTAFAVVVLGAMGVNAVTRNGVYKTARLGTAGGKLWTLWLGVILAVVCLLSLQMAELRPRLAPAVAYLTQGASQDQVERAELLLEAWFQGQFMLTMGLLLLAAGLYAALARHGVTLQTRRVLAGVVVALGVSEMVFMASPAVPQVDRQWYPNSPELVGRLKELGPGRLIGVDTFPANVSMWWGMGSATGYDALDPADITTLMRSATDKSAPRLYAKILDFEPSGRMGVLKAMNVKYLLTSGPREGLGRLVMSAEKFYVYEVAGAMARAYVPRRVRSVGERAQVLEVMNEAGFDPGEMGLVVGPQAVELEGVTGSAEVKVIDPSHTEVMVDMATPGMVVLADAYSPGWEATYNGSPVEILKVNYALRGVMVPAGQGVVAFAYRPRSLRWGFYITCGAMLALMGLGVWGWRGRGA